MISSHYGQFGYFQGLGDIGDLGAAKKRRRGKKSFRRSSMRQQMQQQQQQQQRQQDQQQQQDSGAGGGSGYEEDYEEEGTTESTVSAEQLQALAALMQGKKKRRHRRKKSMGVWGWLGDLGDAVTFGAFGRGGRGGGGRGPGSRAYHYHLQQLAQQAAQQQQQAQQSSSDSSGSSLTSSVGKEIEDLTEGVAGVLGDILSGTLGAIGGALGAAWGSVARLAGWAGIDLGSWTYGGPFGLFSALRPSQSSAWALPSPYAGLGHSEVEQAAIDQRRRGLAAFLHNAFAEMGGGDPRVGQRRLAEAGANYGPDAVIAIQEYLAARGQSPAALQRRLRVLRLEYGRARQQGNMAEANRLYYRINAIESRLGRYGAGGPGPMDTRVGVSIDSDVSVGTSGIPWKPILIGVGVVALVSAVANSKKRGGGGHKAGEAA